MPCLQSSPELLPSEGGELLSFVCISVTKRGKHMENEHEAALAEYRVAYDEYFAGKLKESYRRLIELAERFKQLKDYNMQARSYNLMGVISAASGNTATEMDWYLSALECARQHNVPYVELLCLNNLGSHYQTLGRHEQALTFFERCRKGFTDPEVRSNPGFAMFRLVVLENMMMSTLKLGRLSSAARFLKRIKESMAEDTKKKRSFDILLLESMLLWKQGEKDAVRANLPNLEKELLVLSDPVDFLTRIREYVALVKEMRADDYWSRILEHAYREIKQTHNYSMLENVLAICLDYAATCELKEEYEKLCFLYVEASLKTQEESRQERLQITDAKVELYEKENERIRMQKLAENDMLTGLGSRYSLQECGEKLIAESRDAEKSFAVGILDVDCFKQFNDTYGHLAGDECLLKSAEVVKQALEALGGQDFSAHAFRYGGDEFLILFSGIDEEGLTTFAEKLSEGIMGLKIEHKNSTAKKIVTFSQGYYGKVPEPEETLEDILRKADEQLYAVKAEGKAHYRIAVGEKA